MSELSPREIDNVHTRVRLREDGIIELICNDHHYYEVGDIQKNHDAIRKIAGGKKALVLTLSGKYAMISREGRDYVAEGHHASFVRAEAFVLRSLAHKMMASFYRKMSFPKVQTGYFISERDALKWLKEQV